MVWMASDCVDIIYILLLLFLYSLFDDLDLLNITRGGTGDGVSGK